MSKIQVICIEWKERAYISSNVNVSIECHNLIGIAAKSGDVLVQTGNYPDRINFLAETLEKILRNQLPGC